MMIVPSFQSRDDHRGSALSANLVSQTHRPRSLWTNWVNGESGNVLVKEKSMYFYIKISHSIKCIRFLHIMKDRNGGNVISY